MKKLTSTARTNIAGRIPLLLFWLLGVPLPVILLIWIFRG